MFEVIIFQIVSGLSEGMVVFLCAMGMTLILGSLKVLNIAHGSIYMLGAYLGVMISNLLTGIPGHFYLGIVISTILCALFGGLVEILVIRPIYKLNEIYQFVTTYGVTFIMMDVTKIIWGGAPQTVNQPAYLQGPVSLSGILLPKYNLALIIFGIAVFVAMHLFINRSRFGLIIRGVTVDRLVMSIFGTNVPQTYTLVFMIGCGLAGLGGAIIAPLSAASPGIDFSVLVKAFIVIIVGGFGSLSGAFLASVIVGLTNACGILFAPKVALGFPFFIMLVVLIVRPWGLLGKPIRE